MESPKNCNGERMVKWTHTVTLRMMILQLSGTSGIVYRFSCNGCRLWGFCFGYTLNNCDGEVADTERRTRRSVKFEFLMSREMKIISLCSLVLGHI